MKKVIPQVSAKWQSAGYLYLSDDKRGLGEDMFQAWLPDGTLIDAGWTSEHDPRGQFKVSVSREFDFLTQEFLTDDIDKAAKEVERLAKLFVFPRPALVGVVPLRLKVIATTNTNVLFFTASGSNVPPTQKPSCFQNSSPPQDQYFRAERASRDFPRIPVTN